MVPRNSKAAAGQVEDVCGPRLFIFIFIFSDPSTQFNDASGHLRSFYSSIQRNSQTLVLTKHSSVEIKK